MFYRHARMYISFDCIDREGNEHVVYGGELREIDFEPLVYANKEEAYELTGTLQEWAETFAENAATTEAEGYCGDETFTATNINWDYQEEEEWSILPKRIQDRIDYIEELKGAAETEDEKMEYQKEIDELRSKYE